MPLNSSKISMSRQVIASPPASRIPLSGGKQTSVTTPRSMKHGSTITTSCTTPVSLKQGSTTTTPCSTPRSMKQGSTTTTPCSTPRSMKQGSTPTTPCTTPRSTKQQGPTTTTPCTTPRFMKQGSTTPTPKSMQQESIINSPINTKQESVTTSGPAKSGSTIIPCITPKNAKPGSVITPRICGIPRSTKQGSYFNRYVGTKAVSQGTVSPKENPKGGLDDSCALNDRFESADTIRPSINAKVNDKQIFRVNESSGSGEYAAIEVPTGPSVTEKEKYVNKSLNIPDSPVPLNVLMQPKRTIDINQCISCSPFDTKEYSEPSRNWIPVESLDCIHLDTSTLVNSMNEDLKIQRCILDELQQVDEPNFPVKSIQNKSKPDYEVASEIIPDGFICGATLCNNKGEAITASFDEMQCDYRTVDKNQAEIVLQIMDTSEDMDSIEKITPPLELHEVVSDPKVGECLLQKVESVVVMLESIEPPSLVESIDDLEKLLAQDESDIETGKIFALDVNSANSGNNDRNVFNILDKIINITNPICSVDPNKESKGTEVFCHESWEHLSPQRGSVSTLPFDVNSNVDNEMLEANDLKLPIESKSLTFHGSEVMTFSSCTEMGIQGVFKDSEIVPTVELKNEYLTENQDTEFQPENDAAEQVCNTSNEFSNDTVQGNIFRIEQQFLPYMIEKGLRKGHTTLDCEEMNIYQELLTLNETEENFAEDLREEVKIDYKNLSDTYQWIKIKTIPSSIDVEVPTVVTMLNGIQPLTYLAKMMIKNRNSRPLTYKVLTVNRCRYAIKPFVGYLQGAGTAEISIQAFFPTYDDLSEVVNDSFMVLVAEAPLSELTRSDLKAYWKLLGDHRFESIVRFKVEQVKIVDSQVSRSQLLTKDDNIEVPSISNIQDLMTEDEGYQETKKVPCPSTPAGDLNLEFFIGISEVSSNVRKLTQEVNNFITWGSVSIYLTSLAVIYTLALKDIESIVLPPEVDQEGWFAWIPFFGNKSL